jgi:S-phase kinase-associated protein 1
MDVEKTIKMKSNDGKVVNISSKAAMRSGLLKGIMQDYPEDSEIPLNAVDGSTLEKIKEYLVHYEDSDPAQIKRPLKKEFKDSVDEWDSKFIGDDTNSILALIKAANFMDIKPLLELSAAKVATIVRGTKTETIRKTFEIFKYILNKLNSFHISLKLEKNNKLNDLIANYPLNSENLYLDEITNIINEEFEIIKKI